MLILPVKLLKFCSGNFPLLMVAVRVKFSKVRGTDTLPWLMVKVSNGDVKAFVKGLAPPEPSIATKLIRCPDVLGMGVQFGTLRASAPVLLVGISTQTVTPERLEL